MRLCTRAEIETEMCCGTGGNCDSRSVWTSTAFQSTDPIVDPCDSCVAESQCHTATCSDGVCIQSFKPAGTECDDNDADTESDVCDGAGVCSGTLGPIHWVDDGCHTEAERLANDDLNDDVVGDFRPSSELHGVRCCSNDGSFCTTTRSCQGTNRLTFQQAEAHCENEGMRLCTRAEMETEMCCGTGGNCDSRSVWTPTVSQSTDLIVDPCDSCVAESQCHTATCSDGICIQSFKPANTQCDDNDDSTDGDVCDGVGICVGADATSLTQHEELKLMVKNAFENAKLQITRNALPGLIRKAFHDAGHFDKSSGETRMGCIQHFLSGVNACPQHGNLEEAESFVNAVMNEIPSGLTMADAVQLLGALAVDELAQGTDAPLLYDRVRTGRNDPTALECTDNIEMCNNLPAFFTRFHATDDHEDIVTSLNDVWNKEIDGKMIDVNSLSKQDAVALIGAHTVGS